MSSTLRNRMQRGQGLKLLKQAAATDLSQQSTNGESVSTTTANETQPEQVDELALLRQKIEAIEKQQNQPSQNGVSQQEYEEAMALYKAYRQDPDELVWRMLETHEGMGERLQARAEPDVWAEVDPSEIEANPLLKALKADSDRNKAELRQFKANLQQQEQQAQQARQAQQVRANTYSIVKEQIPDITGTELTELAVRYKTENPDALIAVAKLHRLEQGTEQQELVDAQEALSLPHTGSENTAPPIPTEISELSQKELYSIAAQGLTEKLSPLPTAS